MSIQMGNKESSEQQEKYDKYLKQLDAFKKVKSESEGKRNRLEHVQ